MRKHRWIAVSALLVLASAAPLASADDAGPAETRSQSGYEYIFRDEPLQAAGLEPMGARIQVSSRAARATLIRPRTAFVTELLKSVEHL
jgi:hypothetical protein